MISSSDCCDLPKRNESVFAKMLASCLSNLWVHSIRHHGLRCVQFQRSLASSSSTKGCVFLAPNFPPGLSGLGYLTAILTGKCWGKGNTEYLRFFHVIHTYTHQFPCSTQQLARVFLCCCCIWRILSFSPPTHLPNLFLAGLLLS